MAEEFDDVEDATPDRYVLLSTEAAGHLAGGGAIKGVQVLDYGQGDCSAIVDNDGAPIVFFDMGGGKGTGSQTHPWHNEWKSDARFVNAPWRHKVPELKHKPTVILSHWDGDHYSTGFYLTDRRSASKTVPSGAPGVTDLKWLVPRQCRHPSKLAFVAELDDVSCWPATVAQHRFQLTERTYLQVEQCTGKSGQTYDPNIDGLALLIERVDENNQVMERMLLPGDAPYSYIPSCSQQQQLDKVVALLAFHHGSKTHLRQASPAIPVAGPSGKKIVYTCGLKPNGERCFGHPAANAVKAYAKCGWDDPQTPAGSFKRWPPRRGDSGDPVTRRDILLTFTAPDVAATAAPVSTVAAGHPVAVRSRKRHTVP